MTKIFFGAKKKSKKRTVKSDQNFFGAKKKRKVKSDQKFSKKTQKKKALKSDQNFHYKKTYNTYDSRVVPYHSTR